MNIRVALAKLVSVLMSVGVVAGAAQLVVPAREIALQGGGPQIETQIGVAFEDMVAGTLTPQSAEEVYAFEAATEKTLTAVEVPQVIAAKPVSQAAISATPVVALVAQTPAPTALAQASSVLAAVPSAMSQAIVATSDLNDPPALSRRPQIKNPKLAEAAQQKAKKEAQQRAKAAPKKKQAKKGNAPRNAAKGTGQGSSKKAKGKTAGKTKKPAAQSGNGSASSYPGKVMRRISRQSRPRVRAKGTAVIAFAISKGGGLSRVSVARSSGSAALDRAAVAMVRRAAPFPRPPSGAKRQFSVNIQGR